MPGLMPSAAQDRTGAAMPSPDGGMPPPTPENAAQGQERAATPEEKATHEEFMGQVVNSAYDEKVMKGAAAALKAPQPTEMLAMIISGIVARVAYSGLENGKQITPEMAYAATWQLAADIGTNVAENVGAQPMTEEQIEGVVGISIEMLGQHRDERERTGRMGRNSPAPEPGNGLMGGQGGQQAPPQP